MDGFLERLRRIARLRASARAWYLHLVSCMPYEPVSTGVRHRAFRRYLKAWDGPFFLAPGVVINGPEHVVFGRNVGINRGTIVDASQSLGIEIGPDVQIGPYCVLRAADHRFDDPSRPIVEQGHVGGRIVIEEDCWLGSHVVVVRDVRIGRGSVIGAQSVVTRDIPPFSVAMGVPARVVRSRLEASTPETSRRA